MLMALSMAMCSEGLKAQSMYKVEYYCPPCGCPQDGKIFNAPGVCSDCNMVYRTRVIGLHDKPSVALPRPKVAVLLFDGADIMDVTGPMSVFEHASFNVMTVAKSKSVKRIGSHLELAPDYDFNDLPKVDIIVVPGGGAAESNQDRVIVEWLKSRREDTETMFSVCSGAFFLGLAGILDDRKATTFASLIPQLKSQFPESKVLNDVKYTNNGDVYCSSGLSSGIDASFEVVAKYYGYGRAQDIANHMEYPWMRQGDYARSQLADNFISGIGLLVRPFSEGYLKSTGDRQRWKYVYSLWEGVDVASFMSFMGGEMKKMTGLSGLQREECAIHADINHPELGKASIEFRLDEINGVFYVSIDVKRL